MKDARIRIKHDDGKHGGIFELRIGQMSYADETESGEVELPEQTVRAVKLSNVTVYLLPLPTASSPRQPRFFSSASRSSSTSSTASTSTSSDNGNTYMYMSQAVADLRQSMVSGIAYEASVYQSASSERMQEEEEGTPLAVQLKGRRSRSITPTGAPRKEIEGVGVLLLSMGTEDIVLRMKTTPARIPPIQSTELPRDSASTSAQPASRPRPLQSSTSFTASLLPAIAIDLSIGTVAILIVPSQLASVLSALQILARYGTYEMGLTGLPDITDVPQARVDAKVRLKGIQMCLLYDTRALSDPCFSESAARYWAKPSPTTLPSGHLRLRLESFEGTYCSKGYAPKVIPPRSGNTLSAPSITRRSSASAHSGPRPPVITLSLLDASIFEYLAGGTSNAKDQDGDAPPGGSFPVLIFDSNLPQQYDVAPGARSLPSLNPTAPAIFPLFDSVDWRNQGGQRRSGGAEKAWKVRPKGRGVLKNAVTSSHINENPVLDARKELNTTSCEWADLPEDHNLRKKHADTEQLRW